MKLSFSLVRFGVFLCVSWNSWQYASTNWPNSSDIMTMIIIQHRVASVATSASDCNMGAHFWSRHDNLFSFNRRSCTLLQLHFVTLSIQPSLGQTLIWLVPMGRPSVTASGRPPCLIRHYHIVITTVNLGCAIWESMCYYIMCILIFEILLNPPYLCMQFASNNGRPIPDYIYLCG